MTNAELKQKIKESRIKMWEVAERVGVKKWQGFSDNHTSSSPTHPTRAYEYFHRGKK